MCEWYKLIDSHLHDSGFIPTASDPCVYIKCNGEWIGIIPLYVDDCTIVAYRRMLEEAKTVKSGKMLQPGIMKRVKKTHLLN